MEPPHLVRRSPDWTRWIVGGKAAQGRAASPSQMGRFETQWLAAPANLSAGRQPIALGWRAAFPDWQPADEKGDEAQLLPPLRNGETAQLHDPKIEDKETRPPPRYNEGTLIEKNAWRFVDDEVLRERLKEAKGIGITRSVPVLRSRSIRAGGSVGVPPINTALPGLARSCDTSVNRVGIGPSLACYLAIAAQLRGQHQHSKRQNQNFPAGGRGDNPGTAGRHQADP